MAYQKKTIDAVDARQGSRKKTNLRVLLGSMLLAIIVGGILYAGFSAGPRVEQPASTPSSTKP